MNVLKFGGSSVANAENIKRVIDIVSPRTNAEQTVVVVSALGGITDLLLNCAEKAAVGEEAYKQDVHEIESRHLNAVRELIKITNQSSVLSFVKSLCNEIEDICNGIFLLGELTDRSRDRMMSYGEILSSRIIAAAFNDSGAEAIWLDSRNLICTDDNFNNAHVNFAETNARLQEQFASTQARLFIMPGFVSATKNGITTTLGRGGSDYTAAIVAAALHVNSVEIWTDVSGMMTADPRLVKNARIIPTISYQEAMELSHFGAKIIYPPTIQPALQQQIPILVKNTFAPQDEGTIIKQQNDGASNKGITGISGISNVALVSLEGSGMVGIPGFSKRFFSALAAKKINIILITQGSSEHSICVGVQENLAQAAAGAANEEFTHEIAIKQIEPISIERGLAIIALVGDQMKSHTGISGRFFSALGKNGINVRAIAQGSSERNISTVISSGDLKKATNVIHEVFFEKAIKEINLFIAGAGNVGGKLIEQIHAQKDYLENKAATKIRVIGIANSKKHIINENGVNLDNWRQELDQGVAGDTQLFIEKLLELNLRNSVFADITANEYVATLYPPLLQKSVAVVACNKIASSGKLQYYQTLKDHAQQYNTHFLFETNVGAGLPIIGTLNDLIASGDTIHKMQAVLSGTLNYVFNNYDGTASFASVVRQAQAEGYTEPDPRLDLSGKDVMRKIMILAREKGDALEMEDVANASFLPEECMRGSVEDFYGCMEKHEAHFKKLFEEAAAAGSKLKFVAEYNDGKASVGLQHILPEHDLYHLYGKDNIVLFYTQRYPEQPLVVKGAGAGAEVTASGVFADILRSLN